MPHWTLYGEVALCYCHAHKLHFIFIYFFFCSKLLCLHQNQFSKTEHTPTRFSYFECGCFSFKCFLIQKDSCHSSDSPWVGQRRNGERCLPLNKRWVASPECAAIVRSMPHLSAPDEFAPRCHSLVSQPCSSAKGLQAGCCGNGPPQAQTTRQSTDVFTEIQVQTYPKAYLFNLELFPLCLCWRKTSTELQMTS